MNKVRLAAVQTFAQDSSARFHNPIHRSFDNARHGCPLQTDFTIRARSLHRDEWNPVLKDLCPNTVSDGDTSVYDPIIRLWFTFEIVLQGQGGLVSINSSPGR